ncbi:ig-like domain-containing protein [Trichonephila inaurata madagascariensis]|uniref:Ig-like domain-containing protein n=1 Tax=Trichonephila inaurata madagascariensis TaxID=2747483 RepID=A0A8X6XEW4_9ARAC|nr:ig-like domain-containing protein [Trichonephila inaurata madagascariensis]
MYHCTCLQAYHEFSDALGCRKVSARINAEKPNPKSRKIPPMISVPNQLIGASIGEDATLDCNTEAYPMSINYWTKENSMMIVSNSKYITSIQDNTYKVHMKLTVVSVRPEDYGTYKCSARNSLGTTDGAIRLYPTFPRALTPRCLLEKGAKHAELYFDPPIQSVTIYPTAPLAEPSGTSMFTVII